MTLLLLFPNIRLCCNNNSPVMFWFVLYLNLSINTALNLLEYNIEVVEMNSLVFIVYLDSH